MSCRAVASSSTSCNVAFALRESARRSRPFKPLPRGPPEGSSIAARSLSSRDMRFSAAVNVPWDNGDGFRRLCGAAFDDVGVVAEGAASRAEAFEDDEPVRWWTRGGATAPLVGGGVDPDELDLVLTCLGCECTGEGAEPLPPALEPWLLFVRCR